MEIGDQLQNITELSIAMAGFAGIVFVLGRTRESSDINKYRIMNLLLFSLCTMFIALIPQGFELVSFPIELHARIASGISFLLYGTTIFGYSFPRFFKLKIISRSKIGRIIGLTMVPLIFGNLLLQLVNSLGYFGEEGYGAFYYGLVFMLFAAAIQFMTIIIDEDTSATETVAK